MRTTTLNPRAMPNPVTDATSDVMRYSLLALLLTTVHHAYGAYAYSTPWRLHVAFVAVATAAVLFGARAVWRDHPSSLTGTAARWIFVLTAIAVPMLLFGVFEGFYNHLMKNVLYFGGLPMREMTRLFPPPEYEMPNDAFFEITGVLQVVPTTLLIGPLYRLIAGRRSDGPGGRSGGRPLSSSTPRAASHDETHAASHVHARRWWALALISVAQFMVILDVTVVNVALPSIGSDLHLGRAALTWVVTAYSLAFGGFMLLGGRLADVLGRRRAFVAGLTLFTPASLASGLAAGGNALIAARRARSRAFRCIRWRSRWSGCRSGCAIGSPVCCAAL